jgi:hypothetical protein
MAERAATRFRCERGASVSLKPGCSSGRRGRTTGTAGSGSVTRKQRWKFSLPYPRASAGLHPNASSSPFDLRITNSARFSRIARTKNSGQRFIVAEVDRPPESKTCFGVGWKRPPVAEGHLAQKLFIVAVIQQFVFGAIETDFGEGGGLLQRADRALHDQAASV